MHMRVWRNKCLHFAWILNNNNPGIRCSAWNKFATITPSIWSLNMVINWPARLIPPVHRSTFNTTSLLRRVFVGASIDIPQHTKEWSESKGDNLIIILLCERLDEVPGRRHYLLSGPGVEMWGDASTASIQRLRRSQAVITRIDMKKRNTTEYTNESGE